MYPGFIVDGYNLVHALPELARVAGHDLARARGLLLLMLAAFRGQKRIRLVVVFDGDAADQPMRLRRAGVEAVFSRPPDSADQRIAKMVRTLKHPRAWTVVSSDRWVREQAQSCGVPTMSAEQMARRLSVPPAPADEEKPQMRREDLAYWEDYFRQRRTQEPK